MDRETFQSLSKVMSFARQHGADDTGDDFQTVLDWMKTQPFPIKTTPAHA